jgi:hypothetical protein
MRGRAVGEEEEREREREDNRLFALAQPLRARTKRIQRQGKSAAHYKGTNKHTRAPGIPGRDCDRYRRDLTRRGGGGPDRPTARRSPTAIRTTCLDRAEVAPSERSASQTRSRP